MKGEKVHISSASQCACHPASHYTHQDGCFKAHVRTLKVVLDPQAKVDPQSKGDAGEEDEKNIFAPRAVLGEEQLLEFARASQGAGHGRGYAQLENKLYEQELRIHRSIFSWIAPESCKFRVWPLSFGSGKTSR